MVIYEFSKQIGYFIIIRLRCIFRTKKILILNIKNINIFILHINEIYVVVFLQLSTLLQYSKIVPELGSLPSLNNQPFETLNTLVTDVGMYVEYVVNILKNLINR